MRCFTCVIIFSPAIALFIYFQKINQNLTNITTSWTEIATSLIVTFVKSLINPNRMFINIVQNDEIFPQFVPQFPQYLVVLSCSMSVSGLDIAWKNSIAIKYHNYMIVLFCKFISNNSNIEIFLTPYNSYYPFQLLKDCLGDSYTHRVKNSVC